MRNFSQIFIQPKVNNSHALSVNDVTLVIGPKFDQMYLLISSMQYSELWQFLLETGVTKRRHWDFYSRAREVIKTDILQSG